MACRRVLKVNEPRPYLDRFVCFCLAQADQILSSALADDDDAAPQEPPMLHSTASMVDYLAMNSTFSSARHAPLLPHTASGLRRMSSTMANLGQAMPALPRALG